MTGDEGLRIRTSTCLVSVWETDLSKQALIKTRQTLCIRWTLVKRMNEGQ
jgi:hypothetical protein